MRSRFRGGEGLGRRVAFCYFIYFYRVFSIVLRDRLDFVVLQMRKQRFGQCGECVQFFSGYKGDDFILWFLVFFLFCFRFTVFVLKFFVQVRSFIFIDEKELVVVRGWMVQQQQVDGFFLVVGRILNKDIQVSGFSGFCGVLVLFICFVVQFGVVGAGSCFFSSGWSS